VVVERSFRAVSPIALGGGTARTAHGVNPGGRPPRCSPWLQRRMRRPLAGPTISNLPPRLGWPSRPHLPEWEDVGRAAAALRRSVKSVLSQAVELAAQVTTG
jgi:hypothetical protein